MGKIQIENQLEEKLWRDFVFHHPHGNIFHTPEMFQTFNQARGHQATLWAAIEDGEILALFLPVQNTLFDGPFRVFTSRAVAYGSVLCAEGARGQSALNQLLYTYNQEVRNRVLFTELRNLSDIHASQPVLQQQGYQYEGHLNFLIDLDRPWQEIWSGIRSNARRNIKQAQRSELRIEAAHPLQDLPRIYDVLREVYKRIQVPLPDISLFQAACEHLAPEGMLRILAGTVNGVTIGALLLLLYKDVMIYWYTGTLREYASYRCGDLLVWHSLELGRREGYRLFDFGGGGRPEEKYGVRDFKLKFGGQQVNFGRNTCVHSPMRFKVSQVGYQLVRRFI